MLLRNYLANARLICFDDTPPDGDPPAGDPPAKTGKVEFTPEQQALFNSKLAEERRKTEAKERKVQEGTVAELKQALESKTLAEADRERFEAALANAQNSLLTAEERAANERKRIETDWSTKYTTLEKKHGELVTRTTRDKIDRDIRDAAEANDGFNSRTFVNELKDMAKVVDEVDRVGKMTGRTKTVIEFPGVDPNTNEPVMLTLSPDEAVKRMKEMDDYKHLFRANVAGGAGAHSGAGIGGAPAGNGKIDVPKLLATPGGMQKYAELRKTPEGRRQLGLTK